ncbi:MAG TPA: hypothetical protein ENF23_00470 [Methanosarcinales archaeon]|nr:hypothetical protein [Methanosarcinales archaeon]
MEYETAAQFIELLALLIMVAAFYYGYSLIKFIPKELKSLQLVVLALFFMIFRRVASLFSFEVGWVVALVSAISLVIAILALLGFRRMCQNVRGR